MNNELIKRVREAWHAQFEGDDAPGQGALPLEILAVFEEYIIIEEIIDDADGDTEGELLWQVDWTLAEDGTIVFAERDEWLALDALPPELLEADDTDAVDEQAVVKAVHGAPGEVEVLVPYGGPFGRGVDSQGDYFTPQTDFGVPGLPDLPRPVVYMHAVKDAVPELIGTAVDFRDAVEGRWYRVVLDTSKARVQQSLAALRTGHLRASSQAVLSFVRGVKDAIGRRITHWPLVELTLVDTRNAGERPANPFAVVQAAAAKAALAEVGLNFIDGDGAEAMSQQRQSAMMGMTDSGGRHMYNEQRGARGRRLPGGGAPYVARYRDLWKYDNLQPADQAVLVGVLQEARRSGISYGGASKSALKALAVKLSEDKTRVGVAAQSAMKANGMPLKADEIQQQDLAGFGDEWVGVAYSQSIWDAIRSGTFVAERMPSVEVPAGHESMFLPLEGADPTFYKVAEATDTAASGWPNSTITSSQVATGRVQLTLTKMGARVLWSGELEEDSLIPWVNQLREQLSQAGAEQLEHAIIDGDTTATASTNINDIAGTPASDDLFLMFDGFRKLALVTNTANSRDGGALAAADFLETLKLMGTAGINAFGRSQVEFILDPNTAWKALELAEVKSQDVFSRPTIENGELTSIWGYQVNRSPFVHYKSAVRKANSTGKIDQDTPANNTTGSILAVRWDQWLLGYRRRMTMETTRIPRADTTEIVALARLGLINRDAEASAISFNITV